jgi:hypothetical protein
MRAAGVRCGARQLPDLKERAMGVPYVDLERKAIAMMARE